ncbi:MAG: hypothetical protein WD114_02980 [Phycisphaerales bacterium]
MSFDIYLQTSNLSHKTEKVKHPFTGEEYDQPVGETMKPEECSAVLSLFRERGTAPDEFDAVVLKAGDGTEIVAYFDELNSDGDCSSGSLEMRSLTPPVAEMIFDIANRGNLVMHVVADPLIILATSEETKAKVESRWPETELADTADALFKRIGAAFGQWENYRDQVMDADL